LKHTLAPWWDVALSSSTFEQLKEMAQPGENLSKTKIRILSEEAA
jgi:hypothetical protein